MPKNNNILLALVIDTMEKGEPVQNCLLLRTTESQKYLSTKV